jgi:hypothetical protein
MNVPPSMQVIPSGAGAVLHVTGSGSPVVEDAVPAEVGSVIPAAVVSLVAVVSDVPVGVDEFVADAVVVVDASDVEVAEVLPVPLAPDVVDGAVVLVPDAVESLESVASPATGLPPSSKHPVGTSTMSRREAHPTGTMLRILNSGRCMKLTVICVRECSLVEMPRCASLEPPSWSSVVGSMSFMVSERSGSRWYSCARMARCDCGRRFGDTQ